MKLEEVVKKFKTNPKYLLKGKNHLAERFRCTPEIIVEAKLKLKLEKYKKQSIEIEQITEEIEFKKLFFDIETSYNEIADFSCGWNKSITHNQILKERAVICICYKWHTEDEVHYLTWDKNQCDKQMLIDFTKIIEQADEVIGHNSDKFDIKWLRTRCLYHRLHFPSKFRSLDTLLKARGSFNFNSNRLDYIGQFLGVGQKQDTGGLQLWIDVCKHKDLDALSKMVDYCINDVILLQDVYNEFNAYIHHNTNFAVLNGLPKWCCPECTSRKVKLRKSSTTVMGVIKRHMICTEKDCKTQFDISNRTYQTYLGRNDGNS